MKQAYLVVLIFFCLFNNVHSKESFVIGFSQCGIHGDWRISMEDEMRRELMFHEELSLVTKQAGDSSQLQISQINELVDMGVDLLIISPNEINPVQTLIEKLYKKGIPIILIDRRIESEYYTAYVGGDNYQIGQVAASYIANKLNFKGEVIEILGPMTMSPSRERSNGFNNRLMQYPELKNVANIDTRWINELVYRKLPDLLDIHPNVEALYCFNDELAFLASKVLKEKSLNKEVIVVGIDGLPNKDGGIEMVENGTITATLIYPTGGKEAIQIAAKILHNEPFTKDNLLPTTIVDKGNVEITRLQYEKINSLQKDIFKSNNMLQILDGRYKKQQALFLVTLCLLVIIAVLMVMYLIAFRNKKIAAKRLEEQKEEIATQNSELRRISEELEKFTQERLRFYTNISHEFRTPLTLISGPVDTLIRKGNNSKEQSELLSIAQKNITVLLKLIEQIIDFRKYELGAHGFNPVHADLKKYILGWNDLFKEIKDRKQIDFHLKIPNEVNFDIDFDIEKMERIYTNLLSNAFKFTPEKGVIQIVLTDSGTSVVLEVVNSGKQISQNDLQNIFDRFYQAGSKEGGSGIGLALVKSYVELHNGKIDVLNDNGFVRFTIVLPKKQNIEKTSPIIEVPENHQELNSQSVQSEKAKIIEQLSGTEDEFIFDEQFDENDTTLLIVDDHPGIRSYLKSLLKGKYGILEARDGIDGIRKAIKYIPDLIISDVMMPGIDGVELCSHLKKEISTSHIPIILLTANAQDEKRIHGFESGADTYITKPVNFNVLEVRIRNLIEGRKKLKALFEEKKKSKMQNSRLPETEISFIDDLQERIMEHISEVDYNVEKISSELGLSRVQLYRKVKALTNYSPIEFLINIRLRHAIHLLTVTNKSMKEISEMVGFGTLANFSTNFKKRYRKTPSQYKKEIRNQ